MPATQNRPEPAQQQDEADTARQRPETVEFFDYNQACKELRALGIVPSGTTPPVRFSLQAHDTVAPQVHTMVFGETEAIADAPEGAEAVRVERARLPQLAEDFVHTLHIDEVIVIPLTTWGAVINLVAFDLVEVDAWLDIDAEASLHQNGRDPLQLGPPEVSLITTLGEALQKHGESEDADITIAATGTPLVMELRHNGRLSIQCGHAGMRDTLRAIVD